MSDSELRDYWSKPFSNKTWLGFAGYPDPTMLRMVDDEESPPPEAKHRTLFKKYFLNKDFVEQLMHYNSVEHKKGEDFFSMDKALFYAFLFETFGDQFQDILAPYIRDKAKSREESQQR